MLRAAQQQIQRLYEQGSLSYPRTESDALSDATVSAIASLLPRVGRPTPADARGPLARFDANHPDAHEAVHPMPAVLRSINLALPEWMLDPVDRIVHRITRHLARCVAPIDIERPAALDQHPDWAVALDWRRAAPGTSKALLESEDIAPAAGVTVYAAEEIALRALMNAGLGRASSLVEHAMHAAERGIIDVRGITAKGAAMLECTAAELADPRCSITIEAVLDTAYQAATRRDAPALAVVESPMALVDAALAPLLALRPQLDAALRLERRRVVRVTLPVDETPTDEPAARARDATDARESAHRRAIALAMDAFPDEPAAPPPASPSVAHMLARVVQGKPVPVLRDLDDLTGDSEPVHEREPRWHSPSPTL